MEVSEHGSCDIEAAYSRLLVLGKPVDFSELVEEFRISGHDPGSSERIIEVLGTHSDNVKCTRMRADSLRSLPGGTIIHTGTMDNGHYVTLLSTDGRSANVVDNGSVVSISHSALLRDCSGVVLCSPPRLEAFYPLAYLLLVAMLASAACVSIKRYAHRNYRHE